MDDAGAGRIRLAGAAGLCLCIIAFWMAQHPYAGLVNDGTLYAVAALARLHPESLGHDIFLSQGSQDQYTIFSPIAAQAIHFAGTARGAALLTLIGNVGFFGLAWLLARRLTSSSMAILCVGLLVVLPAGYGGASVFSYSETMLTPRVPAEGLVLGALAAALSRRYVLSGACLTVALLLHPLMAAAGVAMGVLLLAGPRRQYLTLALTFLALSALSLAAYVAPFGPVARFDPEWFAMVHARFHYAFPSLWARSDWAHASVPIATLAAGTISATDSRIRCVCRAALLTGLGGLAASLVASDLLHIVIAAQVQTWRWLWLTNSLAVLLLPVVARDCWKAGQPGQAALLLVGAAWICIDQSFVWVIAAAAVIAAACRGIVTDERWQRLTVLGARTTLLLSSLIFAYSLLTQLRKSPTAPRPELWLRDGVIPAALLILAWWWSTRGVSRAAAVTILATGAGLSAWFAPAAWASWTQLLPFESLRAELDPWRRQIPPTAQVLAPGAPLIPWFILERPSYWSLRQMAGALFSRPTTMELLRRESALFGKTATARGAGDLSAICRNNPRLGFLVTPVDMGPTPFAPVSLDKSHSDSPVRLYRCRTDGL